MKTNTFHRLIALLGYVSCLAATPALAQMGPIQPVLVTDGKVEYSHDRPDLDNDYSVPVEVQIDASGAITNVLVSETSGNVEADSLAVSFMRGKKFLPGLNDRGQAIKSSVKVTVNMYKRGSKKVVRVTVKPPPMSQETLRVADPDVCRLPVGSRAHARGSGHPRCQPRSHALHLGAHVHAEEERAGHCSRRNSGTSGRAPCARSSIAARRTRPGCSSPKCWCPRSMA